MKITLFIIVFQNISTKSASSWLIQLINKTSSAFEYGSCLEKLKWKYMSKTTITSLECFNYKQSRT